MKFKFTAFLIILNVTLFIMISVVSAQPVKKSTDIKSVNTADRLYLPAALNNQVSAGNDDWESIFSIPGTNGNISAVTVYGNDVYIAGTFSTVSNLNANYVAKWDGSSWYVLGSGMNSTVSCLAVDGSGNLYAGGTFTTAGGSSINHIAKWDGSSWSSLGTGTNGTVNALTINGSDIYAGGAFTEAGGAPANHIAKWDGSSWYAMGGGTSGEVYAIIVHGTNVYISGNFSDIGTNIACWNGSSFVSEYFGAGTDNTVYTMDMINDTLYAGGIFTGVANLNPYTPIAASNIARWDAANGWQTLNGGVINSSSSPSVNAIWCSTGDNTVTIGGLFDKAGSTTANNVAIWDGSDWSGFGTGPNDKVLAVAWNGTTLYAGGVFSTAGTAGAVHIAQWNGSSWSAITSGNDKGIYGTVNVIIKSGDDLYAGGSFTSAGTKIVNNIAKWDGSDWYALGQGITDGNVKALTVDASGNIYAGGNFTTAGGVPVSNLAKWDGSSWSDVGSGTNDYIYSLSIYNGNLVAGGQFSQVGSGKSIKFLAEWDGSSWSALGSGIDSSVYTIAVKEDTLFAGGIFKEAGEDNNIQYIAKWDGSGWFKVGKGVNSAVSSLSASGSYLYAAGSFTTAGGSPAKDIAVWDGTSWTAMGTGSDNEIKTIAASGNTCYAGGSFSSIDGVSANNIAKWDGSSWSALGDGTNNAVNSLCLGSLYAGGGFETAGSKTSMGIGKWLGESYSVRVAVKIFLEGPYSTSTGEMNTSINSAGLIPLTSPYSEDRRTVSSIPSDIVDWVLVSLRADPAGSAVAYRSAFLRNDGMIVDDDGTTSYINLTASEDSYYIVIEHRNHLAVMTKTAQALSSSSSALFDFTTDGTRYYLSDGKAPDDAAKEFSDNKWAMYAGDADENGFITSYDLNDEWRPNNGTYGYKNSDMNMDTYINAHDKNRIYKKNESKMSQIK
ncbi:hypothetical protein J7K93_06975 [bacterium]|nr:hypothetical protein [bacterium]